jgi:hypothetical protein
MNITSNVIEAAWLYVLLFFHYVWPILILVIVVFIIIFFVKKKRRAAISLSIALLAMLGLSVLLSRVV